MLDLMQNRNFIVIGASAGGVPAITRVVAGLAKEISAVVLVVMHVSRKSNPRIIVSGFQKHTSLVCHVGENKMAIEAGHLYLAPPDHHMMVKDGLLRITQGPHENKYRPSIDVLFRNVAVNYGNRTIGIILTGLLEDGTSGMWAVKSCGGLCIIQDRQEAQFSDMPTSVLSRINVDHEAPVADIPTIVNDMLSSALPPKVDIPAELKIEADLTERMMSDINDMKKIGDHSDFVCPDCGGGLWALKKDPLHRYRCHTGHVYTEKLLRDLQEENIEESLWVSIRMLEEKVNLLKLMSRRENENGEIHLVESYGKRINDTDKHISTLKDFLRRLNRDQYNSEAS
jgi:two-component system chemotaxis response regulator CheB